MQPVLHKLLTPLMAERTMSMLVFVFVFFFVVFCFCFVFLFCVINNHDVYTAPELKQAQFQHSDLPNVVVLHTQEYTQKYGTHFQKRLQQQIFKHLYFRFLKCIPKHLKKQTNKQMSISLCCNVQMQCAATWWWFSMTSVNKMP